ncbi:FeoA family protein, partial [Agromyces humi]|uniref:FeoA family protein n=1 Tax=Agromyces humi TaxID=1766800 RepID=UPI001396A38E
LAEGDAVLLADAAPGHRGAVVRISDRDPAVLRALDDAGIGLDTVLRVTDVAAASVHVSVGEVDGAGEPPAHMLPRAAAESIWVTA